MKTVCFFGIYDPNYSRTRVLTKGFVENGWAVDECRVDPKLYKGISKYKELLRLGWGKRKNEYDFILVAFPGQTVAWLARIIFGKKVVLDAFLSLYDSNVFDRKIYGKYSIQAARDYFFDWSSAKVSHHTFLDTNEHIKYYEKTFGISKGKIKKSLIGADDSIFIPQPKAPTDSFVVEFHGMFIPLQGIEYILDAAERLLPEKNIVFTIIGEGQTYKECRKIAEEKNLENVKFLGKQPFEKIPPSIANADVCLGIFGSTDKTLRVIPNKVYECAAMGRAVITAESPAVKEVFTDGEDMIFSTVSSGESLAQKILLLRNDPALLKQIGEKARETFLKRCTPAVIVKEMINDIS